MISSLLTVCIGNICRSPMAEGLLRQKLPDTNVRSAGLGALIGSTADPHAVDLLACQGVDISAHRAQQLSSVLCMGADLILVMDMLQKREIESRYPVTRGRVFRLGEAEGLDIFDPYRMARTDFERCLQYITSGVDYWAERIGSVG